LPYSHMTQDLEWHYHGNRCLKLWTPLPKERLPGISLYALHLAY
jgi:hypothetical protein